MRLRLPGGMSEWRYILDAMGDWAEVAQVASAGFTAIAAGAALRTVRHAQSQSESALDAVEAQTQPLIAPVPWGLYRKAEYARGVEDRDPAEISVGVYSTPDGQGELGAWVPIRNVGNGAARLRHARFVVGSEALVGEPENLVLPSNELTRVGFRVSIMPRGQQSPRRSLRHTRTSRW